MKFRFIDVYQSGDRVVVGVEITREGAAPVRRQVTVAATATPDDLLAAVVAEIRQKHGTDQLVDTVRQWISEGTEVPVEAE